MYNATEQFAEFNKAGVAQATKLAALVARERREAGQAQPRRRQGRARAGRRRRARPSPSVKDVQDLIALRAKLRRSRRADRDGLLEAACTRSRPKRKRNYSALAEEAWSAYTKGVAAWVDKASKTAPAGSDAGCQRAQVDGRRDDRRVRPVPEGHEAGREPGRRVGACCRRERVEGCPEGPPRRVSNATQRAAGGIDCGATDRVGA